MSGARLAALGLAAIGLTGCFETGYLLQAGEGQLDLLCSARDIEHVIADPDTSPDVRAELEEVPRIKAFGKRFGLVPTKSYEMYVELDRPVAVWVVSAAPKLGFESKTWTFPIVGSVPYLGWFDKGRAAEHAQALKAEGWDVDLRGAAAYSTLGFFHDPVLSSMLGDAEDGYGDFADTILHESLHATVYVNGQTSFNEGLATFVGEHLAKKYLADRYGENSKQLRTFLDEERESAARSARLRKAFQDLDALYKSTLPDDQKLVEKGYIIAALRAELHMKKPVTNATLAGFRAYHGASRAFEDLYVRCGEDIARMVEAAKRVKEEDFPGPQAKEFDAVLAKAGAAVCGDPPKPPANDVSDDDQG
ncbi:MAG: aminopeptidase [Polyangiaceae bacterium]